MRFYRESILVKAQWTKADVSTLNDLIEFSVAIPDGISDSAMLLDRLGNERVQWRSKDANLQLVDRCYIYMTKVKLPVVDRPMINDWAYLSTNKYTLCDRRKFFSDRISLGKASAVPSSRAAFSPDRLGLHKSNWLDDQCTLADQTSWRISQTSKLDRRNFADISFINGQSTVVSNNTMSVQDLSDLKTSVAGSDRFAIMDRFEIVVYE
jgi:hypothetical protein